MFCNKLINTFFYQSKFYTLHYSKSGRTVDRIDERKVDHVLELFISIDQFYQMPKAP